MSHAGLLRCVLTVTLTLVLAAGGSPAAGASGSDPVDPPRLPPPVRVATEPDGVSLGDPTFEPLPGATADFGRLGGAVYQIEMPHRWNGRLVLFMHGWEEFAPEAKVTAPDIRGYLIGHGYAWGASSFSSTSLIPGRAADETAALWDFFVSKHRRPERTYVTGLSMGGLASHIAAERYANRFDGSLALCGSAGQTPGLRGTADYFAAGAFAAGVTQAELDATTDTGALIRDRIRPALRDPRAHRKYEDVLLDLTGGPRAFDREGFRLEEDTNWRRVELTVASRLAPNRHTRYRLGPLSDVPSATFNRDAIRLPLDLAGARSFAAGNDITGRLGMPMISMHTTGDGQVPIEQARILQRRVEAAGKQRLLVQRVVEDAGHCGFRSTEIEAGFEALVRWVEHGAKPKGTNVMAADLRNLDRTFQLAPRPGTRAASAVRGARKRAVLLGRLTVDGRPLDAPYLGADVQRRGLAANCQYTLPAVSGGEYKLAVLADAEARGCGGKGAVIVLWTFANDEILHSRETVSWPGDGQTATFDASFSTADGAGAATPTFAIVGEAYGARGRLLPPGTIVEAFAGSVRCGVSSLRRTGSFSGYTLAVVGSDSQPGCDRGATLTFRVGGRRAAQSAVNEPGEQIALDLTVVPR